MQARSQKELVDREEKEKEASLPPSNGTGVTVATRMPLPHAVEDDDESSSSDGDGGPAIPGVQPHTYEEETGEHPVYTHFVARPATWVHSHANPLRPAVQDTLHMVHQSIRGLERRIEEPFGGTDASSGAPKGSIMQLPCGFEPMPSYFAQPAQAGNTDALQNDMPPSSNTAAPKASVMKKQRGKPNHNSDQRAHIPYQPRTEMDSSIPSLLEGRALEQYRYFAKRPTPMKIPIYDQACLKYIFTGSFDGRVDPAEWITAASFVLSILTNAASAIANLQTAASGGGSDGAAASQTWIVELSKVVFAVEFAVIYSLLIALLITIADAVRHNNVGSDLAGDVMGLGQRIAAFSSVKVIGWVSPAFASRLIMPHVRKAVDWRKKLRVVFFVFVYLAGCCLATATITLKVTQIDFTATVPIGEWQSSNWLALIGFVLNLAKVDDSYFTETRVLLNAVHRHFCPPGEPSDENPSSETLFSRVLRRFNIPRDAYYEYFEVVFDYHAALPEPSVSAALQRQKSRFSLDAILTAEIDGTHSERWTQFIRFMNFLTFILKIDNNLLRKFLQMTSSPLLFYEQGRHSFLKAFQENDLAGMNLALWRSDPDDPKTLHWSLRHEKCFNVVFRCEEGVREVPAPHKRPAQDTDAAPLSAMDASAQLSSMEILRLRASGHSINIPPPTATARAHQQPKLPEAALAEPQSPIEQRTFPSDQTHPSDLVDDRH